jgi:hypothetical protein
VYTTSLPQVLSLLEIAGQEGMLICSPLPDATASAWQATCLLHEGKVTACQLRFPAGGDIVQEGWSALAWLKAQGGVYWQLKEAPPNLSPSQYPLPLEKTPAPPVPGVHQQGKGSSFPSTGPSPVPRRTARTYPGPQGISLETWPREHRTVFLLINGTRSKADILRLLPESFAHTIDPILADLRAAGIIEY